MDNVKLTDMLIEVRDRVSRLEDGMQEAAPRPWVELFVRDFVQPMKDSIIKMEHAMSDLARETKGTYTAFNEFIKNEEQRKKDEAKVKDDERKENTFGKRLLRFGAYAAAILTLITLFRIAGTYAELYIKTHAS